MSARQRPWVAAGRLPVSLAVVLLVGCAEERHAETPAAGADEVWVVGIGYPKGEWTSCFDDELIAESLMTATFRPRASEEGVRRVVDCLDRSLAEGDVSVSMMAQPD